VKNSLLFLKKRLIADTCAYGDENSLLRYGFVRRDTARDGRLQCVSARQVTWHRLPVLWPFGKILPAYAHESISAI